ncbi:hypothetical protein D3C73_1490520 [compost metagenome]
MAGAPCACGAVAKPAMLADIFAKDEGGGAWIAVQAIAGRSVFSPDKCIYKKTYVKTGYALSVWLEHGLGFTQCHLVMPGRIDSVAAGTC